MKVRVSFRQRTSGRSVVKTLDLPYLPSPNMYLQYAGGYALASLDRMTIYVAEDECGIDGYGTQFSEEEIRDLTENHGWQLQ